MDKNEFIKKIKTKINNSEIQLGSHQNQSRNIFMYVILIVSVLLFFYYLCQENK